MPIKKCSDGYGYGCDFSVEYDELPQLDDFFYYKKTHTGNYHMNTCKDCVRRKRRELGKSGARGYNYKTTQRVRLDGSSGEVGEGVKLYL